jgi:multiple sugar transport system ATP-binding protein
VAEISVRGLTKRYPNGVVAVSDVDLDVKDGELLVLVGPSGCGKSTLLRMIAGLEVTTEGSIWVGGKDVTDAQPRDRDIAMVFQSYALYPHMTVAKNIGYPLKLAKVPQEEIVRRVNDAARLLQLEAVLDRRPSQLSGGQRQRVAMGRAIVRKPAAFLMDEPLSNLDAKLRVQMRAEIARIQREFGITTVYVTHDQIEAMTMGDRVAVLNAGRIEQCDTPRNLYGRPANLFVAAFVGSPAMNLCVGTLVDRTGSLFAVAGDLSVPVDRHDWQTDLVDRVGTPIVIGLRSEAFAVSANGVDAPISGVVQFVEELGSEVLVHATLPVSATSALVTTGDSPEAAAGSADWVARLAARTAVHPGDRITLHVDPTELHLFDPAGPSLRARCVP